MKIFVDSPILFLQQLGSPAPTEPSGEISKFLY